MTRASIVKSRAKFVLHLVVVFVLAASACRAQAILQSASYGTVPAGQYGREVAALGDVNQDGVADYVVAELNPALSGGVGTGRVTVVSGADGAVLVTTISHDAADNYGWSVAGVGDIDGDGISEFLVGAPLAFAAGFRNGRAYLHSGADGSVLHVFQGGASASATNGSRFGLSVAAAGDVNADGVPDLLINSVGESNPTAASHGKVFVYSGADMSLLLTLSSAGPAIEFGTAIDAAGDVDRDGHDDLIVGTISAVTGGYFAGNATVYSGFDGSVIHSIPGLAAGESFGTTVAGVGDLDGDGHPDFAATALPGGFGAPPGKVTVFSGATGAILFHQVSSDTEDKFGFALASAGDYDGDGFGDYMIGVPYADVGSIPNLFHPRRAGRVSFGT